jgi:hypothetical protein
MSIEAMKMALEALVSSTGELHLLLASPIDAQLIKNHKAVTLLRKTIAEVEKQEPVAYINPNKKCIEFTHKYVQWDVPTSFDVPLIPLYTHPQPKREWVGLTDKEIDEGLLRADYAFKTAEAWRAGVVFAMTKLKEKNT